MLIDPMGRVVTELDEAQGEFLAEIDAAAIEAARATMPVLANRRLTNRPPSVTEPVLATRPA
jgi:deaminated glutathione amidase